MFPFSFLLQIVFLAFGCQLKIQDLPPVFQFKSYPALSSTVIARSLSDEAIQCFQCHSRRPFPRKVPRKLSLNSLKRALW